MKSTQKSSVVKKSITNTELTTQDKLRSQVGKTRMAKSEVDAMIHLMQQAADRLDFLESKIRVLELGDPTLNQLCALLKPKV